MLANDHILAVATTADLPWPSYPLPPLSPTQDRTDLPSSNTSQRFPNGILIHEGHATDRTLRFHSAPTVTKRETMGRVGQRHVRRIHNALLLDRSRPDLDLGEVESVPLNPMLNQPLLPHRFDRSIVRTLLLKDRAARRSNVTPQQTYTRPPREDHNSQLQRIKRMVRRKRITYDFLKQYEDELVEALERCCPRLTPEDTGTEQGDQMGCNELISTVNVPDATPLAMTAAATGHNNGNVTDGEMEIEKEEWCWIEESSPQDAFVKLDEGEAAYTDSTLVLLSRNSSGEVEYLEWTERDTSHPDIPTPKHSESHLMDEPHSTSLEPPGQVVQPISWTIDAFARFIIHLISEYYGLESQSCSNDDDTRTICVYLPVSSSTHSHRSEAESNHELSVQQSTFCWPQQSLTSLLFPRH
ncbi:hypothetical protein IWQ62_001952 [Dispira parvispora]|uniref:Uncharacterized protein n=1 Tax=Dispira parvispora TaxID=1520584 RepID=A0A9W8E4D3_9FUNG|nr:hypothetical protein IWQ62_001952 [Dispira parvispora]